MNACGSQERQRIISPACCLNVLIAAPAEARLQDNNRRVESGVAWRCLSALVATLADACFAYEYLHCALPHEMLASQECNV